MAELFADRLVSGAAEPPANLSVALAGARGAGARALNRLYLGSSRIIRSREVRRLFDGIWHVLDSFDRVEQGGAAQLRAMVLVVDDRAHVFPSRMRSGVAAADRAWRRDGFMPVDRPVVELGLDGWYLAVRSSGLDWDPSSADALAAEADGAVDDPPPAGRFVIASWSPETGASSPSARIVAAARAVENRDLLDGRALVEHLVRHLPQTPRPEPYVGRAELQRVLSALGRS